MVENTLIMVGYADIRKQEWENTDDDDDVDDNNRRHPNFSGQKKCGTRNNETTKAKPQ